MTERVVAGFAGVADRIAKDGRKKGKD